MNFGLISKVLGVLLLIVGSGMAICAAFALVASGWQTDGDEFYALGMGAGITLAVAIVLVAIGLRSTNTILRRDAAIAVGLGWILAAVFGGLPYLFSEPRLEWDEAFFEAMSGFTTTGSTVMQDIEAFPRAILLWRSLTQWMGGIGIVVLFVAVLSFLGVGSRNLIMQESSLNIGDSVSARIRDVAKTLCLVYVVLSIICFAGLLFLGMTPFNALCHTFTTLSTGGFSPHNASLGHYDSLPIEAWIAGFMLLGSVGFMLYVQAIIGRWSRIRSEEEARYYVVLLLLATLTVAFSLSNKAPDVTYIEGLRRAFFTIVSISTTTGFGTEDFDQWPVSTIIILAILMLIGGCAGSTAGGLKMNRLIVGLKVFYQQLVRSYRPSQTFALKLNGKAPSSGFRFDTIFIFFAAGLTCGVSMLLIAEIEPQLSFQSVVGAVFGTLFNIGPGFDQLGPTNNFSELKPFTLVFLSFLMAIGRLEFYAILVLFVPSLWKRY